MDDALRELERVARKTGSASDYARLCQGALRAGDGELARIAGWNGLAARTYCAELEEIFLRQGWFGVGVSDDAYRIFSLQYRGAKVTFDLDKSLVDGPSGRDVEEGLHVLGKLLPSADFRAALGLQVRQNLSRPICLELHDLLICDFVGPYRTVTSTRVREEDSVLGVSHFQGTVLESVETAYADLGPPDSIDERTGGPRSDEFRRRLLGLFPDDEIWDIATGGGQVLHRAVFDIHRLANTTLFQLYFEDRHSRVLNISSGQPIPFTLSIGLYDDDIRCQARGMRIIDYIKE